MKRGIITISALLMLSFGLMLLLLLQQDMLRLHAAQAAQRLVYVKQSIALQYLSQQQKEQTCHNLSKQREDNVFKQSFTLQNNSLAHYVWCQRKRLFKNRPSQVNNAGRFAHFIDRTLVPQFQTQFNQVLRDKGWGSIYWFNEQDAVWEINNNVKGIVIATGNLHIKGKGKITGSIITEGHLQLEKGIKVAYNKEIVSYWYAELSDWQVAEKSWYDFNPL